MAADAYDALAGEIERITACPYPTQLKSLRDIAVSQSSDADISQWAAANPCAVDTLASCLLEGLQQWPYVLDIVARFSINRACRDAFLCQEPTLLHSVISQAAKQGETKSKHTRASVALLSMPLPDTVALPADTQTLLMQLVENAANKPCTATIEPVYMLLGGIGNVLFGTINHETLIKFETHLIEILQKGSGSNDSCLTLYCLSIMNIARCSVDPELRLTTSSYTSQDFLASTPTSSRWKAEAMQQFFEGKKAEKSMQFIVLIAYTAIRGYTPDGVKALALANSIVTAIPVDIRKNWCMSNATTVHKLHNKLCDQELDQVLCTLGLRFVGRLCELDSLPRPVIQALEQTFLQPRLAHIAHTLCPRCDDREMFSGLLARLPICDLLRSSIELGTQPDSGELATSLEATSCMMRDMASFLEDQKTVAHQAQELLNDETFVQRIRQMYHMIGVPTNVTVEQPTTGWCIRAMQRKRCALAQNISDLLLRAAQRSKVSSQTVGLLLQLHAAASRSDLECNHERPSWRANLALADGDLSMGSDDQIDWREALHTHFKARAEVEQDAVTRLFAKACASLEARCENVEKPLREEQERRRTVEEHNADLTRAFGELQSRHVELGIQSRLHERERDQYVLEVEDVRKENNDLLDRVSRLEEKLRESQAQGRKQLAELKEAQQLAELDHAALLAQKQEEYDDLHEDFEQGRRETETKAREMALLQNDLVAARGECDRVEDRLANSDVRAAELEETVSRLQHNMEELQATKFRLQQELSDANNNLANGSQEISELQRQINELKSEQDEITQRSSKEIAELRNDIGNKEREAAELARRHQEAIDELEQQIAEQHQSSQEKDAQYGVELQTRDAKIADLRKRITRYQQKCEQKDQQIAEAESMRTNLMAAMGLTNVQAGATLPHRSRESNVHDVQTQEHHTPPTPTSGDGMDVERQEADGSFISNASSQESRAGPTPKRPRSRKSLIVVPATATKTRASIGATKTARPSKTQELLARRQTLGAVSVNRPSQKPVTFKTPTKSDMLEADDQSTFDGSELFAGTQGARMADFGNGIDENVT